MDWEGLLANKTVVSQGSALDDQFSNIYSNYIPKKTVLCDVKEPELKSSESYFFLTDHKTYAWKKT